FPVLFCPWRWGQAELFFEVTLGGHVPSVAVEYPHYLSIPFHVGRYDMDMLVQGIVVPYDDIGLLPVTHLSHVFPRHFIERAVIKVFPMGKGQADMGIAVLGSVALSLKMQYAAEELLRYVL